MGYTDIESQILLNGDRRRRTRKRVYIFILAFVLLATLITIPTILYLNFKDKDKPDDSNNVVNVVDNNVSPVPVPETLPPKVDEPTPEVKKLIVAPKIEETLPKIVIPKIEEPSPKITPPKVDVSPPEVKTPVILQKPGYQQIYDKLITLAKDNKFDIVEGSYEECDAGRCLRTNSFIYEWKIKKVAEYLSELESVDVEEEYKTLAEYEKHIRIYGMYYNSADEYKYTFKLYKRNKKIVEEHNKNPDRLYNMKLNNFAAFTDDEEMMKQYTINVEVKVTKSAKHPRDLKNQEIHVDWRDSGYVTEVIHQQGCGSCWAIAAVDVFNTFKAIKDKNLVKHSYQQLIDCVSDGYDCKYGGDHFAGLKYIKNNEICLDSNYEYISKKLHCSENMCRIPTKIKKIVEINEDNALEMLKKNGPFVTSFDTNTRFVLYEDGIYDGNCEFGNGHSVVVVGHGYDKVKKVNYWIVKNSWGSFWGEDGYFRVIDTNMLEGGRIANKCNFLNRCYGLE